MSRTISQKLNCTRLGQGKKIKNFVSDDGVYIYHLCTISNSRLTVELVKIEDGLFTGEILYHKQVVKTEEELAAIKAQREEKRRLKLQRKKIQSENVDRKLNDKQKSKGNDDNDDDRTDDDDDAAYYKEEVGEEPDKGIFHFRFWIIVAESLTFSFVRFWF